MHRQNKTVSLKLRIVSLWCTVPVKQLPQRRISEFIVKCYKQKFTFFITILGRVVLKYKVKTNLGIRTSISGNYLREINWEAFYNEFFVISTKIWQKNIGQKQHAVVESRSSYLKLCWIAIPMQTSMEAKEEWSYKEKYTRKVHIAGWGPFTNFIHLTELYTDLKMVQTRKKQFKTGT